MRYRRLLFSLGVVAFILGAYGVTASLIADLKDSTRNAQRELLVDFESRFAVADVAPAGRPQHPVAAIAPLAHGLVEMRVPRFGSDWRWLALQGTSKGIIANGPGHYAWSPLPGARGNVAFAAHRAGHGDPFIDFDLLRRGDRVLLSQAGQRWTYVLTTRPRIVDINDHWVLDPLPGRKLTLTTCWPKYGSSKRMFVRGRLLSTSTT